MSITIENAEAEELIAELKRRTGKVTLDLLLGLLRAEKARSDRHRARSLKAGLANARRLQDAWRTSPVIDHRSFDEIVAYDKDGLPE